MTAHPSADESTFLRPGAPDLHETPADSDALAQADIEGARLFGELRARLFGRDSELRVGHYRLLRQLGVGAMGEVQLARDEQLEREVAIKFVRPHLSSARWTEGLRREARALARLAHPNVVRVYEVGVHAQRVFLVMEHIEGQSLRAWIREASPSWEQVLAAYLDAARGLAAAHGAQVIHRDFKPDNVLRSHEGRVAVVDFGLAAVDREPDGSPSQAGLTLVGELEYSQTGELKGTPAYMPREQYLERGSEASDQFSLCVALYEGLWGQRPFPARTLDAILDDRADWEPQPPPKKSERGAPRWLWPVLRRGLAPDPQQRWPSVRALIDALEQGLARRRRRRRGAALGALVLGVGLASGLAAAQLSARDEAPVLACAALERELEGTWAEAEAAALAREYAAAAAYGPSRAWLARSGEATRAGLERWRGRWLASRAQLCEARAGGDPLVNERHASCLERSRRTAAALVELLRGGDLELLRRGPAAVLELADPQACAERARAGGPPPPPEALAGQVEQLRDELAAIEAERALGRYASALTRVEIARERGAALAHEPLDAELAHAHGRLLLDYQRGPAGLAALERAADLAEGSRHDLLLADSWLSMATYAAVRQRELESGQRYLRRAEATSKRVGLDAEREAHLRFIRGSLASAAQDFEAARELLLDARARYLELGLLLDASHVANNLGLAQLELGEQAEALASLQQSLDLREQVYGPEHPELGMAAYNLGQLALSHDLAFARGLLERAARIWREAEEARPLERGRVDFILAQLALADSAFEAGLEHAERAALAFEQALEADAIEHAEVAALRATASYFLNRPGPARAAYEQAVAGYAAAHGEDDPYTALFRVGLGWAALAEGRSELARAAFERGLEVLEAKGGPLDDARLGLVAHALASSDPRGALARLDRFSAPPEGEMDRFVYELLTAIATLRAGPDLGSAERALREARTRAEAMSGGPATLAVLLDSVGASAKERALLRL